MPLTNAEKQATYRARRISERDRWRAALEDIANERSPFPQATAWMALNCENGADLNPTPQQGKER